MTKTVLVTGSSSGLGRATAALFQANGWRVVATMRDTSDAGELARLPEVLTARLDVLDQSSIDAAIGAGIERFGRIDALVNNAGYGAYGALELTSIDEIRRQFDVNVVGLLATTRAILPHFRANGGGAVVNVSSIGGRVTFPLGALYHGSKFAVEGLSESLQYELGAIGVRVKLVEPGGMTTDFGGRSLAFSNDVAVVEYQPLVNATLASLGPMMANGSDPAEIAEVVYRAAID
jgi:NAD(P)-dependent dehydrogenase (short-subunit alcohol dehydrogenase family)